MASPRLPQHLRGEDGSDSWVLKTLVFSLPVALIRIWVSLRRLGCCKAMHRNYACLIGEDSVYQPDVRISNYVLSDVGSQSSITLSLSPRGHKV
jgi:hypothetical protein